MSLNHEVERTFKNYFKYGQLFSLLVMYLIITPLYSLIVSSLVFFIIMTSLFFIQSFIGWRVWKNGLDHQIQHRVMGFFLIFNIGLHGVMPFFFFSFGTIFFYISLAIYLLLLGFLVSKTRIIVEGIHNPIESKIGKAFAIAGFVIGLIAILADGHPTVGLIPQLLKYRVMEFYVEFYVKAILYLLGLMLTFVLPVFFYPKQSKLEEQPRGRRKLSRAKRKALKARKMKVNKNAR